MQQGYDGESNFLLAGSNWTILHFRFRLQLEFVRSGARLQMHTRRSMWCCSRRWSESMSTSLRIAAIFSPWYDFFISSSRFCTRIIMFLYDLYDVHGIKRFLSCLSAVKIHYKNYRISNRGDIYNTTLLFFSKLLYAYIIIF